MLKRIRNIAFIIFLAGAIVAAALLLLPYDGSAVMEPYSTSPAGSNR